MAAGIAFRQRKDETMKSVTLVSNTPASQKLTFSLPVQEYRSLPVPEISGAKLGDCFVRVTDLPKELENFMGVNPRVPNRNKKGLLSGPVTKGITNTLLGSPEDMAIKNQGIYLLVEDAAHGKLQGGQGQLTVTLADIKSHGVVNGGHTYAAIREAVESADDTEFEMLSRAYVRLHLLSGIEPSKVAEIAEGLNRSKQVDDPSLDNLRDHFQRIKQVMSDKPGADCIAYHQGDEGDVYIVEILALLEMFNCDRFSEKKHPSSLYNQPKNGLRLYKDDLENNPATLNMLVPKLPDILRLSDLIRSKAKEAAKNGGFEYGRMKTGKNRAASAENHDILLPFIGEKISYRVPNGWLYPMLAAFRANVIWDKENWKFEWNYPLDSLVHVVIEDLISVCFTAHRDNIAPDKVGKRESIYKQCYDTIQIYLLRNPNK